MKNVQSSLLASNKLGNHHISYAIQLTRAAALACYDFIGKGDEKAADHAAVEAMRAEFNNIAISGRIVIGEGERDEAPMLYIGEKVGSGGEEIDIAVDPLEGTTICASAMPNSIAVLALAPRGGLLHAPDVYMEKLAIGPNLPDGVVSLENSVSENIINLAKAKKCSIDEVSVCILKRSRHDELIAKVREIGARVCLIGDGDVSAVIATALPGTNVDMYMGSGGAPEGVLAAAALSAIGGQMYGKLVFNKPDEVERAQKIGITDLTRIYNIDDMVRSDVIFVATGVTTGWMLNGVKKNSGSTQFEHLVTWRSQASMQKISETIYG